MPFLLFLCFIWLCYSWLFSSQLDLIWFLIHVGRTVFVRNNTSHDNLKGKKKCIDRKILSKIQGSNFFECFKSIQGLCVFTASQWKDQWAVVTDKQSATTTEFGGFSSTTIKIVKSNFHSAPICIWQMTDLGALEDKPLGQTAQATHVEKCFQILYKPGVEQKYSSPLTPPSNMSSKICIYFVRPTYILWDQSESAL